MNSVLVNEYVNMINSVVADLRGEASAYNVVSLCQTIEAYVRNLKILAAEEIKLLAIKTGRDAD